MNSVQLAIYLFLSIGILIGISLATAFIATPVVAYFLYKLYKQLKVNTSN